MADPDRLEVRIAQRQGIPLDAEFRCDPGEVLALVGPSGAGKSTILRTIAGLHRAAHGQIRCGGAEWFNHATGVHLPPQQRRVGMVFQDYALFPHLTARANVAIALGPLSADDIHHRTDDLLERVNLTGLGERLPRQLSGGEQQRVALARALARDPQVLLLDEPFSAVDQVTRRKLRLELAGLVRRIHIPVLLVTHDLDEAAMLGQRMCVVHRGQTLQSGKPAEVIAHPANATVAKLVDTRNLLTGDLAPATPGQPLRLNWQGVEIGVAAQTAPAPGPCYWSLPPSRVILHRRDRPSRGETENPVACRVIEQVTNASGTSFVLLEPLHAPQARLHMDLPEHAASRNSLASGDEVVVSLLAEAIHLMPLD